MPCVFFFFNRLVLTRLQLEPIHAESSRLKLYRPESAVSADSSRNSKKKKKKRCETHCLSQILNPTFSSFHTNTQNKLSASLSLRHTSFTLSVLSASISACCETLSRCRVSHLTHFNSFLLQLAFSHAFLTQVALNLSLIFDFNDL